MPFIEISVSLTTENRLVKIIYMIDKTLKWPLMTVPRQSHWLSKSKKLLILGDAAHAMVPYMSQGKAASQIFDLVSG